MNRPLPGVYLRAGRVGGESPRSPERDPFPILPAAARRGRPRLPRTSPRDVGDACVTVVAAEAGSRPPTPRSPRTPVPCTRDRTCGARYCSGASVPALAPAAGPGVFVSAGQGLRDLQTSHGDRHRRRVRGARSLDHPPDRGRLLAPARTCSHLLEGVGKQAAEAAGSLIIRKPRDQPVNIQAVQMERPPSVWLRKEA